MAKKESRGNGGAGERINKSQAIRDIFAVEPKADSKTVMAKLNEQGIKVSPTMIYYIRSKLGQAKRRARRAAVAETFRQTSGNSPVDLVLRVKSLARDVGGIRQLKKLVDLLAE